MYKRCNKKRMQQFHLDGNDRSSEGDDMGLDLLINTKKVNAAGGAGGNVSVASEELGRTKSISSTTSSGIEVIEAKSVASGDGGTESSESDWVAPPPRTTPSMAFAAAPAAPVYSAEEVLNMKREILYQFARLEKKGLTLPKKFSLSSSLDEMRSELERLKRDMEVDASVRFQRRMLMACVSGVEFLNHKFDPLSVHLDGWSESVQENINDYDDVFEELWEKYHTKVKMAPELRLMFMLGGSAVWFHISHSMFKTMPGVDQVFRQNPELKRQFMDATMRTMQQPEPPAAGGGAGGGGLFGGLGNLMGGLFGGGGGAPPATSSAPPPANFERPNMRGPSDVDDLLNELQQERFNRTDEFEIFSNASGVTEGTALTEDPLATVLMDKADKKSRRRRRTLDL